MNEHKSIYKLRFFFDYNCGGSLWCDNEAAFEKFGVGVLDTDITDPQGNIIKKAEIKLPIETKQKVVQLDKLYSQSLDWNNPDRQSVWDENQWADFYKQARELHKEISLILGNDFEVVYKQE